VLVKMRLGGESNRSLGRILLKSREDYRALRVNRMGGLGALAVKNLSKLSQLIIR
jgi:ATP adenylyltransferase/5',5'''-P-1,P-4-tetraphosphate phosphorylase II